MKKLIAIVALSTTLSGCGTSLTYSNGDVNWKAVAITTGVFVAGVLLCSEYCEVNHKVNDVNVVGGNVDVNFNGTVGLSEGTAEELKKIDELRKSR